MRRSASGSIGGGPTATFVLDTPDLAPVDWTKVRAVAMVDYRPVDGMAAYDMLQAARVGRGAMRRFRRRRSVGCRRVSPVSGDMVLAGLVD